MKPVKVLCNWQPSKKKSTVIRKEFQKLLKDYGYKIKQDQINLRPPRQRTLEDFYVSNWHQDDVGEDSDNFTKGLLILWSNKNSTEVRNRKSKKEFTKADDGDILLIHNHLCDHRMPENGHKRWLSTVVLNGKV